MQATTMCLVTRGCGHGRLLRMLGKWCVEFQDAQMKSSVATTSRTRIPPATGVFKVNFDCAQLQDWRFDWSVVIRDHQGVVCLASVHQGAGFKGPEYEEARACLTASRTAWNYYGFRRVLFEGDDAGLLSKLKNACQPNNELGLIISNILNFVSCSHFLLSCEEDR